MSQKPKKTSKLKISDLAILSGVSVPTIKYCIREGLIQRLDSDGRKTSNYDSDYVDQILLIKKNFRRNAFSPYWNRSLNLTKIPFIPDGL